MARQRNRAFISALAFFAVLTASQTASAMDFFLRTDPATLSPVVADLPLVVTEANEANRSNVFVIWISGDGGWSMLERDIAARLSEAGIPTVAINSFRYFDEPRSPQEIAHALERIAQTFSERWKRERAIFVGYSFGADTGPSALARSEKLRAKLDAAIFLSPSHHVYRRADPSSWLGYGRGDGNVEALRTLSGVPIICVRGEEDDEDACSAINREDVEQLTMPSGHTLHGDGAQIADLVLSVARSGIGGER